MPSYKAPLRDQQFVLHELLGAVDVLKQMPRYADLDVDTVNQVVEEAAKFCEDILQPTNRVGDEEGCTYDPETKSVKTPSGFKEAYDAFREAGWQGLAADTEYGGQGLPHLLQIAFYEMQYSTNQAWAMYPGLTIGAHECLVQHGTPAQKNLYLPKMTTGQWTGTMCLTEPHCGTDLGMLRTKAEPQADGSYTLTGEKIFISSGEHDLAENIVHLVLARLPDAPQGTKGISLFIVPKFVPVGSGSDATVGARNGIHCGGLEHKMGINGNATCQMILDGATGWLVGEPNKGLNAMFVMMNGARLGVGVQGLGITEVAYQNAVAYARDRIQGRSLTGPKAHDKPADPIIVHPDVRRALLTARAYAEAGRAFGVLGRADGRHAVERRRPRTPQVRRRHDGADDADREGVHDRQRLPVRVGLHAGVRRPRLHPRQRDGAVRARCPHQHDLRGHEHHPVARPHGPQDPDGQRRQAACVRQDGHRVHRGERH